MLPLQSNNVYIFIKKYFWIFLFFVLFFLFFKNLIKTNGMLSYNDNTFFYNKDMVYLWGQNLKNGSDLSSSIFLYFYNSAFGKFLNLLNVNYYLASHIIFFIPIIFCCSVYFTISYKITKNYFFGFVANVLLLLSNLSLEYLIFFAEQYFYLCAVLGIVLYYTRKVFYGYNIKAKDIVFFSILSFFTLHPFFFIIFLLYFSSLFIFSHFFNERHISLKQLAILIIISVFINFYWIFPFGASLLISNTEVASSYGSGAIDSVYNGYLSQNNILNVMKQWSHPSAGKYLAPHDQVLSVSLSFFFLAFFLFYLFFAKKEDKNRRYLLFIISCLLLFFSLSFSPNNPLIKDTWDYFWNNFNIFHFFRSFSRFSVLLIPLFIFFSIEVYKKNRTIGNIFNIFLILFIISRFYLPLYSLSNNIRVYEIPEDYKKVNELLNKEKETYSVFMLPINPYEDYEWNNAIGFLPQSYYFINFFLNKNTIYETAANDLSDKNNFYKKLFYGSDNEKLECLKLINTKYILISKNSFNINTNKVIDYEKEKYFFDKNKFTLFFEGKNLLLYINKEYVPLIKSDNLSFAIGNPSKYKLYLTLGKKQNIDFFVNYDNNWDLFLNKDVNDSKCEKIEKYNNYGNNGAECKSKNIFFEGEELSYLWKKPIFNDTHKIVYDYANQWTIDPDYIKKNFSKDYYKENPDGSIDVELVLYFKPQSYFYLGLIISGTTLLACLGYLGWDFVKRRKKKINSLIK